MDDLIKIVTDLTTWYQKNARQLAWRETPSAYHIWISEIMLQQTRVEAVKQYYARFIKELPTVEDLAKVSDEKLLKLWQGLGYYNRAKNLKKAALEIIEQHHGIIPNSYEKLLSLKGIGEYTAGAIASIAFGLPEAAVDGNVIRVLSRLYADNRNHTELKKEYANSIKKVLQQTNPSIFNQALMELGALICLPNGMPKCKECPIQKYCKAYKQNSVLEFPHKTPKKQRRIENRMVFCILCQNKLALHKRESTGLLSNLWELPNVLIEEETTPKKQLSKWDIEYTKIKDMGKAKHIFTHMEWHMQGYIINAESFKNCYDFVWVTQKELEQNYALPSAFRFFATDLSKDFV